MNTGAYDGCTADCKRGRFAAINRATGPRGLRHGRNLTIYSMSGTPGCSPGCKPSGYCGDGKLDGIFGEQCDLGTADEHRRVQRLHVDLHARRAAGTAYFRWTREQCDDGNTVSQTAARIQLPQRDRP